MWWWILTILFFLFSVGSTTLVYFSLRRINQYEGLIVEFQNIIEFATTKMKQVDAKGHYESDDETGFFFQQLKEIQELLNGIFENEENEENSSSDEKTEKN
jgi:biopolymer transport protein ExbB/TolQ